MAPPTEARALTPADFAPSTPAEQRREPRYSRVRKIDIMPTAHGGESIFTPVELMDCSRHGLGFFASVPLEPREEFLVKLQAQKLVLLLYTVRYCLPVDGRFHIGAEFVDLASRSYLEDPQKVLDALLAPETGPEPGTDG